MQKVPTVHEMHVLICLNKREDNNRDCCANTISEEKYKEIREWAKEQNLLPKIKITKTGCLGPCNKGCTIMIYPQNKLINKIEGKEEIKKIILDEYKKVTS